jgi:hypothetical protein
MKKFLTFAMLLFAIPVMAQHIVSLTWKGSTTPGNIGYNVYRALCNQVDSGQCSQEGTFAKIGSSATTEYSDNTVTGNKNYSYYIIAVCIAGCPDNISPGTESTSSNHTLAQIPSDQPTAPTDLKINSISLVNQDGKGTFAAVWQSPDPSTKYSLRDKHGKVLTEAVLTSSTGSYSLNWSGPEQDWLTLSICDSNGCVNKIAR